MTHVKTAEAFSKLVGFCTGYGGKYNPGRQNLRIESLSNQLNEAIQALEGVKDAKTAYDNEVNRRKQRFDQLPRLASSILRTLEASGASAEKLDDARQFVQMITGKSTHSRPPMASGQAQVEKARRSQRQLAFVSKVDSFSKFAQAVATEPLYLAYEPEFSKEGLKATVLELSQLNKQVDEARAKWSNSLIDRNQVMYDKDVSLYNTAKAVKKYVRAIYGHDSAQYELLKALVFIKQTKQTKKG